MSNTKPTRCIDPVMKFCQECQWGWCKYPDWVETREIAEEAYASETGCNDG